jgi:hypothetical protein
MDTFGVPTGVSCDDACVWLGSTVGVVEDVGRISTSTKVEECVSWSNHQLVVMLSPDMSVSEMYLMGMGGTSNDGGGQVPYHQTEKPQHDKPQTNIRYKPDARMRG